MKILILCTGNSCRSQMAHGFLQSFDKNIQVYSAGTHPAEKVNPLVVKIMSEVGIDISKHIPTNVTAYLSDTWDYVITVCGSANETCPAFEGNVGKRLHIGFDDPSEADEVFKGPLGRRAITPLRGIKNGGYYDPTDPAA